MVLLNEGSSARVNSGDGYFYKGGGWCGRLALVVYRGGRNGGVR